MSDLRDCLEMKNKGSGDGSMGKRAFWAISQDLNLYKKLTMWPGKTIQLLKALAALPEDPGSIPKVA
ncbi:hypothetical protein ACQP3D_29115, partial [Escherichia coli]